MKYKWKFPLLLGILALLAFAAYVESPYSDINKNYVYYYSNQVSNESVTALAQKDITIPILEMRLVHTEEMDGYTIETYQEFEIYEDENGNVIKSIPTSHLDYLKYKHY